MVAFGSQNVCLTSVDMFDVGPFRKNTRGECKIFTKVKSILVIFNPFLPLSFIYRKNVIKRTTKLCIYNFVDELKQY